MPAFLVGWGMARSLSHFMDVPLIAATHQHNHMFAGLWGLRRRPPARCLLVHVSGGTTDLLLAERSANGEIILTPCGTSIDLHAGQMIDRVGVALGLPFPCGPQLEKLAQEAVRPYPLKVWFEEGCMSLSGPATAALRAIEKGKRVAKLPWVRFMPLPKVFIIQSVIFVQCTNLRKCFLLAASAPISIFEKN